MIVIGYFLAPLCLVSMVMPPTVAGMIRVQLKMIGPYQALVLFLSSVTKQCLSVVAGFVV